jgi:hypothetical protein
MVCEIVKSGLCACPTVRLKMKWNETVKATCARGLDYRVEIVG